MQSAPSEAQRLVFMSWPGQKELECDDEVGGVEQSAFAEESETEAQENIYDIAPNSLASHPSVMPPKAQKEEMQHKMTIRQLG